MRISRKQYPVVALFLVPGLLLYIYFFALPVLVTVWDSFFYWKDLSSAANKKFVGLENYLYLFTRDLTFWKAFRNTLFIIGGSVVLQVPFGLGLALIVNSGITGKRLFNVAFFMPYILSSTSVALMWKFIYHPQGLVNQFLTFIGLEELTTAWLANPATNIPAILIVGVWQGAGLIMILFTAGLVAIPGEIIESGKVEGANSFQILTQITLPMLKPIVVTVITLVVINATKSFDSIWVLTGGGPFHSTEVLTTWMFKQGMSLNEPALGTTIASFIFFFILLLSVLIRRIAQRQSD